jgi:hypothetical protein
MVASKAVMKAVMTADSKADMMVGQWDLSAKNLVGMMVGRTVV